MSKLSKKQIDIEQKVINVMREHEIPEGNGYQIFQTQDKIKGSKEMIPCTIIHFRKEGNNKIIKALEELGWIKDKVYKNHNGSPAFFCSDLFDDKGELEKTIPMIRMKYLFE